MIAEHIHKRTGRWPLSVSTDRLGLTAMRCAGLLGRIADKGGTVDRSSLACSTLHVGSISGIPLSSW
ncbi:hypothetical protein [Microbacterium sp. UBA3394]|uniref:hypothetical protein n=1 Tax=Microbacterium sp. UBA3394 TaxID=1946945 RepID=UPI000C4F0B34|nr:hypothetical protein [Microbacterium sp. UBA3394]MAB81678.1 hypothetical protein [Planctomycetota bacterium]MAM53287.1 hypothetical protein [Microbacterium sp.]MAU94311.1 hypothetical protein [Fulvimarina sp.]|tara:strand:+ start:229 stop:429 length:201 start_codon:yes stop_codon:yes gene_type:complete